MEPWVIFLLVILGLAVVGLIVFEYSPIGDKLINKFVPGRVGRPTGLAAADGNRIPGLSTIPV